MNIGVTNIRTFKVSDGQGGKREKQYLEMSIRPPFMQSATFTITKNDKGDNENAPDYLINYSYNRKNEKYPRARVGALWNKTSQDGQTTYIGGHIESPLFATGKIYISVFAAKAFEGMPPPTHRHDVVWSPPLSTNQNDEANYGEYQQQAKSYQAPQQQSYQSPVQQPAAQMPSSNSVPVIDIDEDEIPF